MLYPSREYPDNQALQPESFFRYLSLSRMQLHSIRSMMSMIKDKDNWNDLFYRKKLTQSDWLTEVIFVSALAVDGRLDEAGGLGWIRWIWWRSAQWG